MVLSDYLYQKASRMKVPLFGTFELSPVCNFACKMCYIRKTAEMIRQEGKSLIPAEKWLQLAKECREEGMLYLLLTGGEPFLYPGFRELYEKLHELGFLIYINTNGTMINEDTVHWLKKHAPCRVNVTLYGSSRETYERICGHSDGYDRAVKAIRMLKDAGIPVLINASMIPENASDMERIMDTGKELNISTRVATYMFPPMRRDKERDDSRFTPEESAQMYMRRVKYQCSRDDYCGYIRSQLDRLQHQENHNDDWGMHQDEFMRCRAGRSTFWVNWEGEMTACGMLEFPMKVYPFRDSFHDCWMKLTDTVRNAPVLKGCIGCEKKEICNPCVAMIYGETGSTDQKAPYMCRLADEIIKQMNLELEDI